MVRPLRRRGGIVYRNGTHMGTGGIGVCSGSTYQQVQTRDGVASRLWALGGHQTRRPRCVGVMYDPLFPGACRRGVDPIFPGVLV